MNYPAAELRGIEMNFYLINPDAEHRGILLIKMKKTKVDRELLDAFIDAESEQVRFDLISDLDEFEMWKFFYILELRMRKKILEKTIPSLSEKLRLLRHKIEQDRSLNVYKN